MSHRALALAAAGLAAGGAALLGLAQDHGGRTAVQTRSGQTTTCPAAAPQIAVTTKDLAPGEQTEPLAADRLLLCHYSGFDSPHPDGSALVSQVLVTDRPTIDRLRTALDRLRPTPEPIHCPADDYAQIVEIFGKGDQEVWLTQAVHGCERVTSSVKDVWGHDSTARELAIDLLQPPG